MRFVILAALLAAARPAAAAPPPYPPLIGMISGGIQSLWCVLGGRTDDANDLYSRFGCVRPDGTWQEMPPAPEAVSEAHAATIGDILYVPGGRQKGYKSRATLQRFHIVQRRWLSPGPPLPAPRWDAAVAVADGKLVVIGGDTATDTELTTAEIFDPEAQKWTALPPMPTPRSGLTAGAIGSVIYAAGGLTGARYRSELEAFDLSSGQWSKKAPMPLARTGSSGGVLAGKLYVVGGNSQGRCLDTLLAYDPSADRWEYKARMPQARCDATASVASGFLYVWGGGSADLIRYDPETDSWTVLSGPQPRVVPGVPARQPPAVAPAPLAVPSRRAGERPDDFALVVGVENYRNVPRAAFAVRDAEAFAQYANLALGVPKDNVKVLTGDRATRTDLARFLEEWLPKNVEEDSRVYVYFSGHGTADPKTGSAFILPWDGDASFLETSAYPLKRLYSELGKLRAREAVVFLDSCFSGAGGRSVLPAGTRPLVSVVDTQADRVPKVTVLTASAGDEFAGSLDREGHGLFTYFLLKGLDGGALSPGQDHLTVGRLHDYVRRSVLKAAHRDNREQTPQLLSSNPRLRLF